MRAAVLVWIIRAERQRDGSFLIGSRGDTSKLGVFYGTRFA